MIKKFFPINRYYIVALAASLLLLILIFKVPSYIEKRSLLKLGYNEETISIIKKFKLGNKIISQKIDTPAFKANIVKSDFDPKYFDLYVVNKDVDQKSFEMYNSLLKKGYSKQQIIKMFSKLRNFEIRALLVFDVMDDKGLDEFIQDCEKHPQNNENKFELSKSYLKPYENVQHHDFDIAVLINYNNDLKSDKIGNLVEMDVNYASEGLKMQSEAYNHFVDLCKSLSANKMGIYATDAYRSFEEQKEIYESTNQADVVGVSRPGFSDLHTGLSALVTSSSPSGYFKTSQEYKWLLNNAHLYGFIFRYPEGKEIFTGKDADARHLRYIGIEAATKCFQEKLSLEEYYKLYIENSVPKEK